VRGVDGGRERMKNIHSVRVTLQSTLSSTDTMYTVYTRTSLNELDSRRNNAS